MARLLRSYPNVYAGARPAHSRLMPPVVVGAFVSPFIARPIKTHLSAIEIRINRIRRQTLTLPPYPVIVNASIAFYGPRVLYTRSPRSARGQNYRLRSPVVVSVVSAQVFFGPKIGFAALSERGKTIYVLREPAVIEASIVFRPIKVEFAPQRRGKTINKLRLPIVISGAVIFRPVKIKLVPSGRSKAISKLNPPAVIGGAVIYSAIRIKLTPLVNIVPRANSALLVPIVVSTVEEEIARPIVVKLAYLTKISRKFNYVLSPPVVIKGLPGPQGGTLISLAYSIRGKPKSTWIYPTIIKIIYAAGYLATNLAPTRRPITKSYLKQPIIVGAIITEIYYGPKTKLALSKIGKPISKLRPPAVVGAAIVFAPVQAKLAYSRRGKPINELKPPSVIASAFIFRSIQTTFAVAPDDVGQKLSRRAPHSKLKLPAVINSAIIFRPVAFHLTYSKRGEPQTKLFAPSIIGSAVIFAPLTTKLSPSTKIGRVSHLELRPPTVIGAAIVFAPVSTKLAPSTKLDRIPHARLQSPTIVEGQFFVRPIKVTLAFSARGKPQHRLFAPAIISGATIFRPVVIKFSPSSRGKPISKFIIPTVVFPFVAAFYGPTIKLTPSKRGIPKSRLSIPVVIDAAIIFRPIVARFAYHDSQFDGRRRTIYGIRPPLVSPAIIFRPVITIFSPAVHKLESGLIRHVPHSKLRAPVVVGAVVVFIASSLVVKFAPSKRGKPTSKLFSPTVIAGATIFRPIKSTFAPSTKIARAPHSKLKLPVVIEAAIVFAPIAINLALSTRGKPKSRLYAPAIVAPQFFQRSLQIFLVPSSRGISKSKLYPPSIIAAAVVFRPIDTLFASQKPIEIKTRRVSHSTLKKPIVVGVVFVTAPISIKLTSSTRISRVPLFKLNAPVIITEAIEFFGPKTKFAASTRLSRIPHSVLKSPSSVGTAIVFAPINIHFALSTNISRISHHALGTPTIVLAELFVRAITIKLAPSRRVISKSVLSAPVIVSGAIVFEPISVFIAKQNLIQDRSARVPRFKLRPPAVIFTGSQKGYHSRTKINSRESTLVIVLNKPENKFNSIENDTSITKRGSSRDRINDRESDLDIS